MRNTRHLGWIPMIGAIVTLGVVLPRSTQSLANLPAPVKSLLKTEVEAPTPTIETLKIDGEIVVGAQDKVSVDLVSSQVKGLKVKVGDMVTKGQVLAVLTPNYKEFNYKAPTFSSKSEAQHAEQLSNALGNALSNHEGSVTKAKEGLTQAKADRDARLKAANEALSRVKGGSTAEVQSAQDKLDEAKAARDKAQALADRDKRALEEGWVSRNQATASRQAFEQSQGVFEQAEARFNEVKKGASDTELAAANASFAKAKDDADARVAAAEAELQRAEGSGLAFSQGDRISIPTFRMPSDSAIKGRIAKTVQLKAPVDGTVTKLVTTKGTQTLEIVKSDAHYEFIGRVPQAEIQRYRVGTIVRFPNESSGVLTTIGGLDPKTNMVAVRISYPGKASLGPTKALVKFKK